MIRHTELTGKGNPHRNTKGQNIMDALAIAVAATVEFYFGNGTRKGEGLCIHWDMQEGETEPLYFAHNGRCHDGSEINPL